MYRNRGGLSGEPTLSSDLLLNVVEISKFINHHLSVGLLAHLVVLYQGQQVQNLSNPLIMPSRASATPVTPPSDPTIRAVASTIDPSPEAPESSGPIYAEEDKLDIPGPSTAFIPRQPSPPLPDLRRRPHPLDEGSDDEEDDEVVATLPIYLSPRLYPHIQLFQYPLHHRAIAAPSWAIDRGKQITTRFKEGVGRVEVEIPVDADTGVWRDDRARELGFVTDVNAANGSVDVEGGYGFGGRGIEDKKKGKKEKEKKQMWGDKVRLRSEVVPGATGYYSGIIHDGEDDLSSLTLLNLSVY